MQGITFDVAQWLVNQGVAVAVLAFVLLRLDSKLDTIAQSLQKLVDSIPPK